MPFKIVRNDITQMHVDAIVNTANAAPIYSTGVDYAVYKAAGEEQLLAERKKTGFMEEVMRIAVDEIHAFLLTHEMLIYLVVFDTVSTHLGMNLLFSLNMKYSI